MYTYTFVHIFGFVSAYFWYHAWWSLLILFVYLLNVWLHAGPYRETSKKSKKPAAEL